MKNKQTALRSITRRVRNGADIYEVYLGVDITGKQIRISRNSEAELKREIENYFAHVRAFGPCAERLDARQIYDALAAYDELRRAGLHESLTAIVGDYISRHGGSVRRATLGEAYGQYLASFDAAAQAAHIKAIKARVGAWVKEAGAGRSMDGITADGLKQYLDTRFDNPKTYNNVLTYTKAFLRWCAGERLGIVESPAESLATRTVGYKEPEFIEVAGLERVVRILEQRGDCAALAYVALAFFAGIRFEEISRLTETADRDLLLDDGMVRISRPKGFTKGIRPRAVQLTPNAAAWLALPGVAEAVRGMDAEAARERAMGTARVLGVAWPHNAARHSFITYHVAAFGEPSKTEAMAGTSSSMRVNHYMGLASKAQGERFFGIFPMHNNSNNSTQETQQ